ncbi:MAG: hypothetical protein ACE5FB_02355 [Candidatus Binatia bacterium]
MDKIDDNQTEIMRLDEFGNFKCVRCGWNHSLAECAEYRLAHANRELDKVTKFLHTESLPGSEGESPVDTLLRWYKIRTGTEVTDMMRKEEDDVGS